MTNHPITPPPELVREWVGSCSPYDPPCDHIATQAARWGADQELEACCEWLLCNLPGNYAGYVGHLRAARRPKPPSLKRLALNQLKALELHGALACNVAHIRRALEALPND